MGCQGQPLLPHHPKVKGDPNPTITNRLNIDPEIHIGGTQTQDKNKELSIRAQPGILVSKGPEAWLTNKQIEHINNPQQRQNNSTSNRKNYSRHSEATKEREKSTKQPEKSKTQDHTNTIEHTKSLDLLNNFTQTKEDNLF